MQEVFTSSTQYGDLKGNVTIDGFDGGNLHDFAQANGVNTNQYFPIGIDIYIGEHGHQSISIITIDVNAVGIGSIYENIKDYLESNEEIDVKKFTFPNVTLNDYLQKCKRFSIVAASIPELIKKQMNVS